LCQSSVHVRSGIRPIALSKITFDRHLSPGMLTVASNTASTITVPSFCIVPTRRIKVWLLVVKALTHGKRGCETGDVYGSALVSRSPPIAACSGAYTVRIGATLGYTLAYVRFRTI
jgi:hypothetical protein